MGKWYASHKVALNESRITDARHLLDVWTDITLDSANRHALGDILWATTHFSLGIALCETPIAPSAVALTAAIDHYEAALRVYTEGDYPQDWAMTLNNLATAYANLPMGNRGQNLMRAIGYYEITLQVHTEGDYPQDWATTQNDLGNAYAKLPTGDRGQNLMRAIGYYEAALRVYTERESPQDWATTQHNLGIALINLARGTNDWGAVLSARTRFALAERGFAAVGMAEDAAEAAGQRKFAEDYIRQVIVAETAAGEEDGRRGAGEDRTG